MRNKLLDVVSVETLPEHQLYLIFENGEKRIFDMTSLLKKSPFQRLKGAPLFRLAKVDYGTVVWPGDIDVAPETLYDNSMATEW